MIGTQITGALITASVTLFSMLVMGWLGTRYMAKMGTLPGQVRAMEVMQTTIDALTAQLNVMEKRLKEVETDLAEEKAKTAALTLQLAEANRELLRATTALVLKQSGSQP